MTTDERIRDIVDGAVPFTHDELEISGYKDALHLIHKNYKELDADEKTILLFHEMIVKETAPAEAGKYKTRDNLIMEYLPNGSRRIRFKPVFAKDTKNAIEQLLLAYYDARQDLGIPELLLIPCVVVDFLCIHPFLDGNGRISRLLTVLLLYIAGYDIGRFVSIEGKTAQYKEAYYDALEKSSKGWHENANDYAPFIVYFLQVLYRCFKDLDETFMDISLKKAKKTERVEAVLLNAIVPVSKRDIAEKVSDVSIKTIELTLRKLLEEDKIKKIGTYKDARYMRK